MSDAELEALRKVDQALSSLGDAAAQGRVLRWACEKYLSMPAPTSEIKSAKTPKAPASRRKRSLGKARTRTSVSIVKDLDLKPKGKESWSAFSSAKLPSSNPEKCLTAVYYLAEVLGVPEVSSGHVLTCFKASGWRVPTDLPNTLQWAASAKGWLNTSKMSAIKVTVMGQNFVEHDLPHGHAPQKKK